ncbi:MAG: RluA family pseudouridine synthase [Candidatus Binataceae bacterium]|nr:RluA family pseudouridine synthase [Candidatus Binataceae bacterium]
MITTNETDAGGERLDHYLVRLGFAESRRAARDLIDRDLVTVNGYRARKGDLIRESDRVDLQPLSATASVLAPDPALAIELLYSDPAIIVVNKPGLMPCHPLHRGEVGTVMNAVVARFPEVAQVGGTAREGGLVHRLDNGTSGALMIARNDQAYEQLRRNLKDGAIRRSYLAMVAGRLETAIEIDDPIGHRGTQRMATVSSKAARLRGIARPASSHIAPLRPVREFTLVSVTPQTGSRHQIRVHLASRGLPIAGDTLYGGPPIGLAPGRFWLHLSKIDFDSGRGPVHVSAPLPADLAALLAPANTSAGP